MITSLNIQDSFLLQLVWLTPVRFFFSWNWQYSESQQSSGKWEELIWLAMIEISCDTPSIPLSYSSYTNCSRLQAHLCFTKLTKKVATLYLRSQKSQNAYWLLGFWTNYFTTLYFSICKMYYRMNCRSITYWHFPLQTHHSSVVLAHAGMQLVAVWVTVVMQILNTGLRC